MIRAIVQFESEPDAERYRQHVEEYVVKVPGATFRHGRVIGSPFGEPAFRYYAEFEWPDRETFTAASRSEEFAASGRDAMSMGIPFTVHFAELE
ncbi:MAG TPA: hypothetical protein VNJ53_05820 [Gaiellaceae bacterium]|nr:hypothetical protein [Gaiellaceae bacterium]